MNHIIDGFLLLSVSDEGGNEPEMHNVSFALLMLPSHPGRLLRAKLSSGLCPYVAAVHDLYYSER